MHSACGSDCCLPCLSPVPPTLVQWLEEHRSELVRVAARRVDFDPEDVVQTAVDSVLRNRDLAVVTPNPWTYLVNAIRGAAGNARRAEDRRRLLRRAAKDVAAAGHSHGRKSPRPRAD